MYAAWYAEAASTLLEHKKSIGQDVSQLLTAGSSVPSSAASATGSASPSKRKSRSRGGAGRPVLGPIAGSKHSTAAVATLRHAVRYEVNGSYVRLRRASVSPTSPFCVLEASI